ncbi:MAG: DUF554 domain-containing protein [Spirochaetes bacterium]|uniref:DUF554 domain-containing protein n=1 Tax=Candidatus Gallitreponema excrementavium TaxID=2840840 RepID=A0A9D9HP48_9SPIR|nr:DUF554 domain-containing protein [Candidatus Gallitreponema excrementavium]
MIAVFVNCAAVFAGSVLGLVFSRFISEKITGIIKNGAGTVVLVLGISMSLNPVNIVFLALAVIAGGLVGSLIDIEGNILKFGEWAGSRFEKKSPETNSGQTDGNSSGTPESGVMVKAEKGKNFGLAFLNASVLFCVGAMAIVGSVDAGIKGDYTVIYTKSVLDFFMAIVFASIFGGGTLLSVFSILIYQGILTLVASLISPFVTEEIINALSATGGVLLVMIGLGLLSLKDLKTANFLPSLVFIVIFIIAKSYISPFFPV